jgi:hypothetical protein
MTRILSSAMLVVGAAVSGCQAPYALSTSAPFVHVVLFKAKATAPAGSLEDLIRDLRDGLSPIPAVKGLWVGRPAPTKTPERSFVIDDYDVGLMIATRDQQGLDEYLNDPRHQEFLKKYGGSFDVRVVDFTTNPSQVTPAPAPSAAP